VSITADIRAVLDPLRITFDGVQEQGGKPALYQFTIRDPDLLGSEPTFYVRSVGLDVTTVLCGYHAILQTFAEKLRAQP
jgi:hypothetical protein